MKKTSINWYELKDKIYIYLKKEVIKQLIEDGIKKSGSLSKLCTKLNTTYFYTNLRNSCGISIKKAKELLDYIEKDYNLLNSGIIEIRRGNKFSIKNPKFPISLMNEGMGSILGHSVSDGCLYYDKSRKDLIRTKYCSPDNELIDEFKANICNLFGEVTFSEEVVRNSRVIRVGNSIIGETLKIAGAPVGKKYELNSNIPGVIKYGTRLIKRNYLSAIFDDEGSVGEKPFPYVILSRNVHMVLNNKEKRILNKFVVPLMKSNFFRTGHECKRLSIRKVKSILSDIKEDKLLNKILNYKPRILIDESNLLKSNFGINNSTYVMSLQLTTNLRYSVQSSLVIRNKEEVINFYKNIGFKLKRKQDKLRNYLINSGRLKHGS